MTPLVPLIRVVSGAIRTPTPWLPFTPWQCIATTLPAHVAAGELGKIVEFTQ